MQPIPLVAKQQTCMKLQQVHWFVLICRPNHVSIDHVVDDKMTHIFVEDTVSKKSISKHVGLNWLIMMHCHMIT